CGSSHGASREGMRKSLHSAGLAETGDLVVAVAEHVAQHLVGVLAEKRRRPAVGGRRVAQTEAVSLVRRRPEARMLERLEVRARGELRIAQDVFEVLHGDR